MKLKTSPVNQETSFSFIISNFFLSVFPDTVRDTGGQYTAYDETGGKEGIHVSPKLVQGIDFIHRSMGPKSIFSCMKAVIQGRNESE